MNDTGKYTNRYWYGGANDAFQMLGVMVLQSRLLWTVPVWYGLYGLRLELPDRNSNSSAARMRRERRNG
jgi:hypothetical protein